MDVMPSYADQMVPYIIVTTYEDDEIKVLWGGYAPHVPRHGELIRVKSGVYKVSTVTTDLNDDPEIEIHTYRIL